jgi:hypothetical protein
MLKTLFSASALTLFSIDKSIDNQQERINYKPQRLQVIGHKMSKIESIII